jgi:ABC-type transporter Mla subunit MlaD
MSDEARRFRLGLFVIVGICLLAGGVIAVSAGRLFQRTHPVYCYFKESVQGLDQGSAVKFRGVEVGRVDSVNVMPAARIASSSDAPRESALVEVKLDLVVDKISDDTSGIVDRKKIDDAIRRKVAQGLRVRISWKDITGLKYLDLDYVDPKTSKPPELPFTPPGTWIPTSVERSFSDIQRDVATVASQLAQVDIKGIGEEIKGLVTALRSRVEDFDSKSVAARVGDAADALRDLAANPKLNGAIAHLESTMTRVDDVAMRLDDLVSRPALANTLEDAAATAASLRKISGDLETAVPKLTQTLDETLASLKRSIEESRLAETSTAARGAVVDVQNAARQISALRETARRTLLDLGGASRGLSQLVRYVEENPDALIHGKLEEAR